MTDVDEAQALLIHPYYTRGAAGAEHLLWWLHHHPDDLRFISGKVTAGSQGPIIHPVALIFEIDNQQRVMVQPWVDDRETDENIDLPPVLATRTGDPVTEYPSLIQEAAADLLLNGLRRIDDSVIRHWETLVEQGQALGFIRFIDPIEALTDHIRDRRHIVHRDWQPAAQHLLTILKLSQFARTHTPDTG